MVPKTSLRDFQHYLAGRLHGAAQGPAAKFWLGVRAGELGWLVDLADCGEIVQAVKLTPVPLTRPWLAGIANIRGNLHTVADFSLFGGGAATPQNADSRLLLLGGRHAANAALLVSGMLGLKNPDEFTACAGDPALPPWGAGRYVDERGVVWHKLSVRDLLTDNDFMNIGA
jgi:twitching motility protein PilI